MPASQAGRRRFDPGRPLSPKALVPQGLSHSRSVLSTSSLTSFNNGNLAGTPTRGRESKGPRKPCAQKASLVESAELTSSLPGWTSGTLLQPPSESTEEAQTQRLLKPPQTVIVSAGER